MLFLSIARAVVLKHRGFLYLLWNGPGLPAKIKKDRIDQHSPRCPDRSGPSVLSKLVHTLAIEVPRRIEHHVGSKVLILG